ncbi:poly-beta-1,6 N-acetyl-D-glucosamine export porin PgaA [Variovorax sp. YR216]|uniref:poly-beta-1,6 N-acetyl-D-glucosamine export porin PgaA n=1 Tax=Variovorax sp. YR216 TaxID=1882828 RepID=UPI0008978290|nr:poly-beta-1,6 N-acetyl-D-glucosamine export porin PgaA [Variovorax sp. YR216]SEB14877.1 poly-beta-1,6 N-acetyl-D-glucosamine export porin PgaA [Variovorax sp. YR216]
MAPSGSSEVADGYWRRRMLAAAVAISSCTCASAQHPSQPSPRISVAPTSQREAEAAAALLRRGRDALRAGDRYAALAAIAQAHRLEPDNAEIAQALADVLMELGAPTAAADALGARADLGVRSRVAGQYVRWATLIEPLPPDPRRRFDDVDPALGRLDALLAEARAADPPDAGLLVRLQRDRAVALRRRERWQDTVDQVAQLRAAGDVPPVFVLEAEADALLALRRPQDARRAYEEALQRLSPAERDDEEGPWWSLMTGRAYAEVESEDFDAAFATVDALVARAGPPWRGDGELQTPRANDKWLEAQAFDAALHSYADMPAAAWARIEPLALGAPALPWLRAQSVDIEAQRGWLRRAEQNIDIAAAMAPEDFGIRVAQVDSDIRRHRLLRADERMGPVLEQGADMPRVQEVKRELDAAMGPSVRFELGGRDTSGEAVRGPGNGSDASLEVQSATIAGVWRLIGLADNSTDSVEEGRATRRRLGGGAQARWPDWKLVALAWSQDGSLSTSGGSLAAQWEPTDQWTLEADAAKHSPDASLRADLHGITADSVRGGARYAWNESFGAGLQLQHMDFSDGNNRQQATVDGVLKLLDRPHLDITLKPRIEWQSNSLAFTPYFSPKESWLGSVEAQVEHVMWRVYERTFVQRLGLTLGVFEQTFFGSKAVGGVAYEQSWRHDPWTEVTWGLAWTSMVYDGNREQALRGYVKFEHRFGR